MNYQFVDISTNRPHVFKHGCCVYCGNDEMATMHLEPLHCDDRAIAEAQQRSDFDARR